VPRCEKKEQLIASASKGLLVYRPFREKEPYLSDSRGRAWEFTLWPKTTGGKKSMMLLKELQRRFLAGSNRTAQGEDLSSAAKKGFIKNKRRKGKEWWIHFSLTADI